MNIVNWLDRITSPPTINPLPKLKQWALRSVYCFAMSFALLLLGKITAIKMISILGLIGYAAFGMMYLIMFHYSQEYITYRFHPPKKDL